MPGRVRGTVLPCGDAGSLAVQDSSCTLGDMASTPDPLLSRLIGRLQAAAAPPAGNADADSDAGDRKEGSGARGIGTPATPAASSDAAGRGKARTAPAAAARATPSQAPAGGTSAVTGRAASISGAGRADDQTMGEFVVTVDAMAPRNDAQPAWLGSAVAQPGAVSVPVSVPSQQATHAGGQHAATALDVLTVDAWAGGALCDTLPSAIVVLVDLTRRQGQAPRDTITSHLADLWASCPGLGRGEGLERVSINSRALVALPSPPRPPVVVVVVTGTSGGGAPALAVKEVDSLVSHALPGRCTKHVVKGALNGPALQRVWRVVTARAQACVTCRLPVAAWRW